VGKRLKDYSEADKENEKRSLCFINVKKNLTITGVRNET
jgi:hypothetical protein